jgi:hypothetical protein
LWCEYVFFRLSVGSKQKGVFGLSRCPYKPQSSNFASCEACIDVPVDVFFEKVFVFFFIASFVPRSLRFSSHYFVLRMEDADVDDGLTWPIIDGVSSQGPMFMPKEKGLKVEIFVVVDGVSFSLGCCFQGHDASVQDWAHVLGSHLVGDEWSRDLHLQQREESRASGSLCSSRMQGLCCRK